MGQFDEEIDSSLREAVGPAEVQATHDPSRRMQFPKNYADNDYSGEPGSNHEVIANAAYKAGQDGVSFEEFMQTVPPEMLAEDYYGDDFMATMKQSDAYQYWRRGSAGLGQVPTAAPRSIDVPERHLDKPKMREFWRKQNQYEFDRPIDQRDPGTDYWEDQD